jgi:FixJ family two-component response regulator
MLRITGVDLSRKLLQIRLGLRVILCTGLSNFFSEEKARIDGIMGVAMKPLVKKDLTALVREMLKSEK